MDERKRTRVRACADALHAVKDSWIRGIPGRTFYRLLLDELRSNGKSYPLSVRVNIHDVRQQFGSVIFVAALLDWPARKVATKLRIIPEHGSWSQAFRRTK